MSLTMTNCHPTPLQLCRSTSTSDPCSSAHYAVTGVSFVFPMPLSRSCDLNLTSPFHYYANCVAIFFQSLKREQTSTSYQPNWHIGKRGWLDIHSDVPAWCLTAWPNWHIGKGGWLDTHSDVRLCPILIFYWRRYSFSLVSCDG